MELLLSQLILVPAIAGLLCILLPRVKYVKEAIAGLAAAYVFYLSIMIWNSDPFVARLAKFSFAGIPVNVDLVGGPLSQMVVLFIGLFGILGIVYSWRYRKDEPGNHLYYAYMIFTVAASDLAVLSDNLLAFVIFWEISTLLLYGLISCGHQKKSAAANAGFRTFGVLGFSEAAMLLGILIIWAQYGTLSMSSLSIPTVGATGVLLYLMFFSAAAAKAGAIPFHSWIPIAAGGAPTSIMAFLPASIDKLLGIYLLAKISMNIFVVSKGVNLMLMIIGAVTIIVAVLLALAQRDLKKLLAYDAISQAGYMVLGIGTGTAIGIIGGLFHLINTAIFKSCLFFGAGSIEKQTKTTDFDELGGLAKYMPLTFFCMLVAGLSVSGVPPFNGFTSKWLIYQSCIEAKQPIMLIVAMIGSALTLALFIKVIYSVFFGTKPTALPEIKEVSPSMTIPQIVLALLCIFFGVFAVFPVGTFLTPIVNEAAPLSIISSLKWENTLSLWNPSVATILLLIGLVVGVIIYFIGKSFKPRRVATYYGGNKIDDEDVRVPGTGFYETIEKLPILRTMYHDNESGVWDPDYFFSSIIDGVVIRGLKFMHSGNLSTYLSWAIIGLVAIIGALIW